MTEIQLQEEMIALWGIVNRLEKLFASDDRKFTVDGHLLGSIGEVYAKEKFNLKLYKNSEKIHDAFDEVTGERYQIKITQRNKVGLRREPDNLIIIKIENDGKPHIKYKGAGKPVWEKIRHQKSVQKFIYLNQLPK